MQLAIRPVSLFSLLLIVSANSTKRRKFYETVDKARLDKKGFDALHNIHMNWYSYAVKALLGQMGKQLYKHLQSEDRMALAVCLKAVNERLNIQASAKCLVDARERARAKLPNGGCNNAETDYLFCDELESSFLMEDPSDSAFTVDEHQSVNDTEIDNLNAVTENDAILPLNLSLSNDMSSSRTNTAKNQSIISTITSAARNSVDQHPKLPKRPSAIIKNNQNTVYTSNLSFEKNLIKKHEKYFKDSKVAYSATRTYGGRYINVNNIAALPAGQSRKNVTGFWRRINNAQQKHTAQRNASNFIQRINQLQKRLTIHQLQNGVKYMLKPMKQIKVSLRNKSTGLMLIRRLKVRGDPAPKATRASFTTNNRSPLRYQQATFNKSLNKLRRLRTKRNAFSFAEKPDRMVITEKLKVIKMDSLNEISSPPQKSPIQKFTSLLRMAIHGNDTNDSKGWMTSYKKLLDLKRQIDEHKKMPGAKVYQERLYDIIIDDSDAISKKPMLPDHLSPLSLIESYRMKKKKQKNMNFKFLSPRFGSLMPDKMESASKILSPSILSFYEDNSTDNLIPVPKLLREAGIDENDREIMMDMLMDISGAKKTVDATLEIAKKLNVTGMNKEFYEATTKFDKAFKELESSFDKHQKSEIDKHGYTFLESIQLKTLMKKHGVNDPKEVEFDVDEYKKQTKKQRHIGLWKRIEEFARNKTERRPKRAINWLSVLQPMILSPYMFAPIFGVTVLGPVVLSPNIFSPLILNPAVMSPYILSPGLFMPFIISPYVLSPYILTPLLGAPFVLSPYCLSPNILNPYLMSPLILSPYILSPDILSPQALGGPILSPSAFSPAVLTESVLMVSFLSPTFMS